MSRMFSQENRAQRTEYRVWEKHRCKAITLVELLISVMLISLMLVAVWAIYGTGYNVFYGQYARQNIKGQTSLAFITMTNELHQALSVTAATATSLTVAADINNDGLSETLIYSWSGVSGDPLNRNDGTNTRQLVRSVNNAPLDASPLFYYYGVNNADLGATPTVSQVRLVLIDLTTASGDESFHLRTKAQLKCI